MMAYRTPHQFGKAPLPPGLGELNMERRMGNTPEDPIDASMGSELDSFEVMSPDPANVPDAQSIGAAKAIKYRQLGAAGGEKVVTFFRHPITHFSVGTLTGVVLADTIPEAAMDKFFKATGMTLLLTGVATFGLLSVMYK